MVSDWQEALGKGKKWQKLLWQEVWPRENKFSWIYQGVVGIGQRGCRRKEKDKGFGESHKRRSW